MKVLNLYPGLGGNRRLWENTDITAVEINPTIAKFYKDSYPDDEVIVGDAHQYLLDHFREFGFIWSSIECPSHSRARFWTSKGGKYPPVFPDMKLYEEILFLRHYFDGGWVVENVKPYYKIPHFVEPTISIERHLFWSNFSIPPIEMEKNSIFDGNVGLWQKQFGIDISGYKFDVRKDKLLRNCVHPKLGLHVLNCAKGIIEKENVNQMEIF